MFELGLLYRLETLLGTYSISAALYGIMGLSTQSSWAILFIAPVLASKCAKSYPLPMISVGIQSIMANTVFVILFVLARAVSNFMSKFRRLTAVSLGSTTLLFSSLVLVLIKSLLSGPASMVKSFENLDAIVVLSLVPCTLVLFLHWSSPSPRKVSRGDCRTMSNVGVHGSFFLCSTC